MTLIATVPSGQTGTVTFYDGTTVLGTAPIISGEAMLMVTLPAGTHAITAVYNGDTNYSPATSPSSAIRSFRSGSGNRWRVVYQDADAKEM